jgi:hypothetical protein
MDQTGSKYQIFITLIFDNKSINYGHSNSLNGTEFVKAAYSDQYKYMDYTMETCYQLMNQRTD